MQQLIAAYLFQHKTCPLPGLGTLTVSTGNTQSNFVNKELLAPVPQIYFESAETPADGLVDFIAAQKGSMPLQVIGLLGDFCSQIKRELVNDNAVLIKDVGNFYNDATGSIKFIQTELPKFFLPAVITERTIHTNAIHTMLVGDKETTTLQMEEYYDETAVPKNYWWVWAVVLAAAAISAIVIYFNQSGGYSYFGNCNAAISL